MEIITRTRTFKKYLPNELNKKIVESATFIVFDHGEYESPDLVSWEKRRVSISDNHQGLVDWSAEKKQYVRMFYMSERDIGQPQYVLIEEAA